jgi:predicted RNA polymerase sigma factor
VLTRSLGVRRLELVEDVVQAALVQALETWSRRGVPEDPAGWLYRTARNLAIDALRRERTHAQALPRLVCSFLDSNHPTGVRSHQTNALDCSENVRR